jgi:hypothetical protein
LTEKTGRAAQLSAGVLRACAGRNSRVGSQENSDYLTAKKEFRAFVRIIRGSSRTPPPPG